ncbi:hypothetical protein EJ110_NYTH48206 [Nymphaea thermarum]|nr:hypothetical protein EJ110_NYTH48206 [Nymphaea thermarum]
MHMYDTGTGTEKQKRKGFARNPCLVSDLPLSLTIPATKAAAAAANGALTLDGRGGERRPERQKQRRRQTVYFSSPPPLPSPPVTMATWKTGRIPIAGSNDRRCIIDKRWTGQLHQPLHAAAFYLNPAIRFSPTFKKDREVMHGLLDCINVLVEDSKEQDDVHTELDLCDSCFQNMGLPAAVRARTTMRPELKKELARKHTSQFDPISLENFDDLEPWIEEEPGTIFDDEDLECFTLEAEATEGFVDEGESATAGAEYVGEDLPILDDEDEEEDEDEDDEDYE